MFTQTPFPRCSLYKTCKYLAWALLPIVLLLLPAGTAHSQTGPLSILRITPSGEDVRDGRQLVIVFDRAVVPLGRMERSKEELPVRVTPNVDCEWRWLNPKTLACQLTEETKFAEATQYQLKIKHDVVQSFKARDGAMLNADVLHRFNTQRPKVENAWFETWKGPGWPVIQISLNQEVDPESLEESIFVENAIGQRHSLEFEQIIAGSKKRWRIEPASELPLDSPLALVVSPGLRSTNGTLSGIENRKIVAFYTFADFRFIGVVCRTLGGEQITLRTDQQSSSIQKCDPTAGVGLAFSAPVIKDELKKSLRVTPDLAGGRDDFVPWDHVYRYSHLNSPHKKDALYQVYIPFILKSQAEYHLTADVDEIQDEFGRPLIESIDWKFRTDDRPPKHHFGDALSVLEKKVDTHLPIYTTNLQSIHLDYSTLTLAGVSKDKDHSIVLPEAPNVAFASPIKIRDLLNGESGVVWGHFSTTPKTPRFPSWYWTQITPFHAHLKFGHFNSIAWVTDLKSGEAVSGAKVELIVDNLKYFASNTSTKASSLTGADGLAILPGISEVDPKLTLVNEWRSQKPRLFLKVTKGRDLAFLPLHYDFRTSPYGTYASTKKKNGHITTWGTTAQGVYRAGDTVQFKLYVRQQDSRRFIPPPKKSYTLEVIDPLGKKVMTVPKISLNEFGSYDGELRLLKNAAVGWYRFELTSDFAEQRWTPLSVLVTDFTPALFKVRAEIQGKSFSAVDDVNVLTTAVLHSGGPYVGAGVRVNARLQTKSFRPDNPALKDFRFSVNRGARSNTTLYQTQDLVDNQGEFETEFSLKVDPSVELGNIKIESAVRDDRGKYIAATASAEYVGRKRFVGLRQQGWISKQGSPSNIEVVVVDPEGEIKSGEEVSVVFAFKQVSASRVKGAGNAYLTKYVEEWVTEDECQIVSSVEPSTCSFIPQKAGYYRITASVTDSNDLVQRNEYWRWVVGKGRVLWGEENQNRLKLIPEENQYSIGETARFLVKNPYPGAQALVTLERYGVLKSWTTVLKNSTEVIEFPIEKDYLPGLFVSVVVMSPRVDTELSGAGVDLGKPAYRLGYFKMKVVDTQKQLRVSASVAKGVYRPGDQVEVNLNVKNPDGSPADSELAVIVLDEAVFDLIQGGETYFDPYSGFYRLQALDVLNFNLLKQLVGQRKYEKKGANPGGGGGRGADVRSIFKYVSYWNPSLKPGKEGVAKVTFKAPDNLTGWKVLALAVDRGEMMGLGSAQFKVNKETELRSALPNQVVAGDAFNARFTLMNRTDQTRTFETLIRVSGSATKASEHRELITLEPYKRGVLGIPVETIREGSVRFDIAAGDDLDQDRMRLSMPVAKRMTLLTAASYSSTENESAEELIAFPEDMRTDVGRVSVVLSSSVIAALDGAFEYLRDYPYTCWEQKLTKAVAASQYLALKEYLRKDLHWKGADALVRSTIEQAAMYQAPSGAMAYYKPREEYASPYLSAYTALAFTWLKKAGYEVPQRVEEKLHSYLKKFLRKEVQPEFYSKGMASTVRAVALSALASAKRIDVSDLSRYRKHLDQMSLFGKVHFLSAATKLDGTPKLAKSLLDTVLGHADETSGKLVFSEMIESRYQMIHESPMRTNCAILSSFLEYRAKSRKSSIASDIPMKLVRAITQRRKQKHYWENTQENIFCLQALSEYSRAYEKREPNYKFNVALGKDPLGKGSFKGYRQESIEFDRQLTTGDPGMSRTLKIKKTGPGRLYHSVRVFFAPKELPKERINSGMVIKRQYSVERDGEWVVLDTEDKIARGELLRVDLFVSLPAGRNFVLVEDPIPGGLEPVNTQLKTTSAVDAGKAQTQFAKHSFWYQHDDWRSYGWSRWSFYHRELRHDSARFYSEYLPPGNYHLSYTAQAIAPGRFVALPASAEEMYDPDVFGKGKPGELVIEEVE